MPNNSQHFHKTSFVIVCLFFISGFCSLLYQTVWLRLAFAKFGVITPVVSVVVSLFMLGLALGSRLGGKHIALLNEKTGRSGLFFYAMAEIVTALGGIAVPFLFNQAEALLLNAGSFDSSTYLGLSAVAIGISILPWAVAMGATFPFALSFLQHGDEAGLIDKNSFGHLYVANVAGAIFGAAVPVGILIELMGLQHCLWLGASLNVLIALVALSVPSHKAAGEQAAPLSIQAAVRASDRRALRSLFGIDGCILFSTGLVSLAMEVAWIRLFTPVLGTVVYSFAGILTIYLGSTFVGCYLYRLHLKRRRVQNKARLMLVAAGCALLPIILNDPRWGSAVPGATALLSIGPFCAALGYLTPLIIDEFSEGDPELAGSAYGVNVVGGIIGPLAVAYILLPLLGVKMSLILLSLPLLVIAGVLTGKNALSAAAPGCALVCALLLGCFFSSSWEERLPATSGGTELHRDYAATTVCITQAGVKRLYVNGISMTQLSETTKYMAHAPLSMLPNAKDVLVICFGMGTTYRSMLTWPVNVTAIELVPGILSSFHYFWSDADKVMMNRRGQVIIDDGRRYLKRTSRLFDLITVDPPPPVEAAGSSLLYSTDFYKTVKEHLKPGGIFCQWYPAAICNDGSTWRAVSRSIADSFKYVQVYSSVDNLGCHFFCSQSPIEAITPEQMWQRMPDKAKLDMLEFAGNDPASARHSMQKFLSSKTAIDALYDRAEDIRVSDDHPYNEYYLLRRQLGWQNRSKAGDVR